jgi:hypothetical protein
VERHLQALDLASLGRTERKTDIICVVTLLQQ